MENYDCSTLCDRIKKRTGRKPSIVVKKEIVETLPNYPAQIQCLEFIKKEKPSAVVSAMEMSETTTYGTVTPLSDQPIKKKSGRKPSTVVKKEIVETLPCHPAPIIQVVQKEKPSVGVRTIDMSETTTYGTATPLSVQPIKKKSGRKPSTVAKKEIVETLPNYPAPTQSVQKEKPSTVVSAMEMSGTTTYDTATPLSVQPMRKKSGRKPSTVVKKEIVETLPNYPAPIQSVRKEKPSTVVSAMEMSETTAHSAAPPPSVQPIKKKPGRKPSTVGKKEIVATLPDFPVPIQSVQIEKPSTIVNAVEMSETIASGAATTASAHPIKTKSDGIPSVVVNAVEYTAANDTAPTQSTQPIRRRNVRKPKVIKRGKNGPNVLNPKRFKAPRSVFVPVASKTVMYKGSLFTVGDIVSVVGEDDRVYYAQIRGLLQTQYGEKSAALTWLYPTKNSPISGFDPMTYILGYDEDIPRDLEYLEFVCHAPNEYFQFSNPSFPQVPEKPVLGFAKTRKGFVVVKLPCEDFNTDSE